jgi:hypothetical protein
MCILGAGQDVFTLVVDPTGQILSEAVTQEITVEEQSSPIEIPIPEALSVVFELSPLTPKISPVPRSTVFPSSPRSLAPTQLKNETSQLPAEEDIILEEQLPPLVEEDSSSLLQFCPECVDALAILYNSFQEFTQICKLECEVGRRLQELDKLRESNSTSNLSKSAASKSKRRSSPGAAATTKKRGRPPKRSKSKAKGPIKEEVELLQIKREIASDLDGDNDGLSEFEDEFYFKGRSESESPPDSPVNLGSTLHCRLNASLNSTRF